MAQVSKSLIYITPKACIAAAIMLLVIPIQWAFAWLIAATCHEIFHCLALVVCGKTITGIKIDLNGAQIQTGILSRLEAFICSLAGPAGGLILLLLSGMFPRLAVCAMVQSAFNLLPVYPLDGGRALQSAANLLFSEHTARRICGTIENVVLLGIFTLGLVSAFCWRLGIFPVLLVAFFIMHTKKIKISCKWAFHRVQ